MTSSTTLARAGKAKRPSPWRLFLQGFFKHPVMVGSVIPSSKRTIERMLKRVDWANTRMFVEYGPGVGTFCRTVLDRLPADARYVAIDTNPDFVAYLKDTIRDSRFSAVNASAADVEEIVKGHGADKADYVLSGLPFSTLPPGVADEIASATKRALKPGGTFMVYLYNPRVRDILARHFERIDHEIEWWNAPPTQMWWAYKD